MALQPVLQFDVEYPAHLSRWKIFVKWLLAIPHYLVLYALGGVIGFTTMIAFIAILFTGKYPRGMFNLAMLYLRWSARLGAYLGLMRDEYPPFGDGAYPVTLELDYPERLSRWKIFVKLILLIPHMIILSLLGIVSYIVTLIAWWAILITGRYPQGMFNFMVGFLRWSYRVNAYAYLMTDAYPPFTLGPVPSPTAGFATGMA
jgi:hypothetical protein